MLSRIYVRDFAIVEQLELDFGDGFTALTGETGAGKSIIIDALNMCLGSRADASAIREGKNQAEVCAVFDIATGSAADAWLRQHDLSDADECLLRRVIIRGKTSKAYINSRPVSIQALAELGQFLVDVHGQHEHQSLIKADTQRQIIDGFAGIDAQLQRLADVYDDYQRVERVLNDADQAASQREAEIDLLRFQCAELDRIAPEDDEFTRLADEAKLLNHAEDIRGGLADAISAFADNDASAGTLLQTHLTRISSLREHAAELGDAQALLETAVVHLDEAVTVLRAQHDRVHDDPERLHEVESRMSELNQLARKHRVHEDTLGDLRERLAAKLASLENSTVDAAALAADRERLRADYLKRAAKITNARKRAAAKLSGATTDMIQALGMPGGQFVAVLNTDPNQFSRHGCERLSFQVAANPGQTPNTLAKVASGGELARISLAIDVVTTAVRTVSTLVFDEVDSGIGGATAEVVGRQLRALGDTRQVLCVTHLAQVAAHASHQLRVVKQTADALQVDIELLDKKHRVEEIARMLGGLDITKQTRAHARDMLNRAAS